MTSDTFWLKQRCPNTIPAGADSGMASLGGKKREAADRVARTTLKDELIERDGDGWARQTGAMRLALL